MAKPVLGKSMRSDWFFLGRDFAVRTVSMKTVEGSKPCSFGLEQSRQIQNLQPKQRKKMWILSFFIARLPEKIKTLKFYWDFKDGWRRRIFSEWGQSGPLSSCASMNCKVVFIQHFGLHRSSFYRCKHRIHQRVHILNISW